MTASAPHFTEQQQMELLVWCGHNRRRGTVSPSDREIMRRFSLRNTDDALALVQSLVANGKAQIRQIGLAREIDLLAPILPAPAVRAVADIPPAVAPVPVHAVPFEGPRRMLSDRAKELLRWLTSLADAGEPCPSNAAIEARVGAATGTASHLFSQLERAGLIEVVRDGTGPTAERIVTIVETGKSTAPRRQKPARRPAVQPRPLIVPIAPAPPAAPPPVIVPPEAEEPHMSEPTPPTIAAGVACSVVAGPPALTADVKYTDGEITLTVWLSTDPGPTKGYRPFLTIPLDEMHALELGSTAMIALREARQAREAA